MTVSFSPAFPICRLSLPSAMALLSQFVVVALSTLSLDDHTFKLNNVIVAPQLVRNLLSVRQFTRNNNCSIEFDALNFSVKDPKTRTVILRCNSDGDLYTIPSTLPQPPIILPMPPPCCGIHVLVILRLPP